MLSLNNNAKVKNNVEVKMQFRLKEFCYLNQMEGAVFLTMIIYINKWVI